MNPRLLAPLVVLALGTLTAVWFVQTYERVPGKQRVHTIEPFVLLREQCVHTIEPLILLGE